MLKKVNGAFFDGYEAVVLDAPQLFESGLSGQCRLVVSVLAPERQRRERIMERDGISEEEADRRMRAQLSEAYFREHSDLCIENTGSLDTLHAQVQRTAQAIEGAISGALKDARRSQT